MYTATKEFNFEAAHMLDGHTGKCKNLHGHNYKVLVTMSAARLNEMDMVKDFYDINQLAKSLFDEFDHAFIYNTNAADDFEHEIATLCKTHGRKVKQLYFRATAENMAELFYKTLKTNCPLVTKVTVYETPTSYATYEGDLI